MRKQPKSWGVWMLVRKERAALKRQAEHSAIALARAINAVPQPRGSLFHRWFGF